MGVFNPNVQSIYYASYFGNIGDHIDGGSSRLDPAGIMYHSLCTSNSTLPTSPSVWSPTKQTTGYDIGSWKFNFQPGSMTAGFTTNPSDSFCVPGIVSFHNTSAGALSFLWDFGDGSPTSTLATPPPHTYTAIGTYTIKLYTYNVAACKLIDSAFHTIHAYRVRDSIRLIPPDTLVICDHDSTAMNVDPQWTINVVPNTHVSYKPQGGTRIMFYPDTNTTYTVHASLPGPCGLAQDSVSFTVALDTSSIPHINRMNDTILCKGDTAVFRLEHKLPSFSISPAGFFRVSSDSMSIQFFPPVTTAYMFIGINANRCRTIQDTLAFTIHRSTLKAMFGLSPKNTDLVEPIFQLTNTSQSAQAYKWYANQSVWTTATSPSLTATDTGYYCFMLVANDDLGCVDTATDCGHVFTPLIYIPSAFSPNGDMKNDVFRPVSQNVTIMEFSVYNRYGQRIFVAFDDKHGWDGTYKGEQCDLDTYFYQVRYRILGRAPKLLKGDVTLLR